MHKKSFLLLSLISFVLVLSFSISGKAFALTPFTHDLHYGMINNDEVKNLQNILITKQMYSGPINGNYYSKTRKAVKALQQQLGVEGATGYFGEKTRILVNQAITEGGSSATSTVTINSTTTQSDTSSTSSSSGTDISDVASTTVKLSQSINDLSSRVGSMEDSISSLSGSIETINNQIAVLQALIVSLTNQSIPAPQSPQTIISPVAPTVPMISAKTAAIAPHTK